MSENRIKVAAGAYKVAKMMKGLFEAAEAQDKFKEFDDALKEKGYGCATKEELAKHKELFIDWMKEGGTISTAAEAVGGIQGLNIYSGFEAQIGQARIWGRCRPTPLNNARDKFYQGKNQASPIILDLDGDGVETKAVNRGAYFDHDGNGLAESTGWVGADDGLLVRDVDGSGWIDTGAELFGNHTRLSNGQRAANGFEALSDLDSIANGGNADGKLDASDAAFASLKVWKDADGDGYHSAGEVISLEDAGVQSINVGYSNSTAVDAHGNAHSQIGSYTTTNGATRTATDVWFQADKMNTLADDWLEVPDDIAAMPDIRGFGNVYSLQQAMVRDGSGTLKALVQQFANAATPSARMALMDSILVSWAGANNIASGSRGSYMDARQLTALEAFMGESLGKKVANDGEWRAVA